MDNDNDYVTEFHSWSKFYDVVSLSFLCYKFHTRIESGTQNHKQCVAAWCFRCLRRSYMAL